jgi:calcineurin-like phosphoesterase family protein
MSIFFTSDTHFNHINIVKYCKRPFNDVEHMNRELTNNWNERIKPDDTLYHLGDFAMGKREFIAPIRKALNGRIILIRGNHDRSKTAMLEAGFDEVYDSLFLELNGLKLWLQHKPLSHIHFLSKKVDYHLCGHVHEKMVRQGKIINVGVDVRGFKPVTLEELLIE